MSGGRIQEVSDTMGERLVQARHLDAITLGYVSQKRQLDARPLWRVLISEGLINEDTVVQTLADTLGLPFLQERDWAPVDAELAARLTLEFCRSAELLPLSKPGGGTLVVLGDTLPEVAQQSLAARIGIKADLVMAPFSSVRRRIQEHFQYTRNHVDELARQEVERLAGDRAMDRSPESWLNHVLHWAVQQRATDIHLTPGGATLHVLFRVDGVLAPMMAMPIPLQRALSFVKLKAEMDISEQRRPQDGSFRATVWESPVTVRVSTVVTEYGERMVMRLLPESVEAKDLATLGFLPEAVHRLEQASRQSAGMLLVTGPTGAGKSSTLHACLRKQHLIARNVLTVEDPLEYRVPAAGQTEVNRKAGYDFASALRHFLRHDPDVILLGEMRDAETAHAAFEAAATGHLVLSTLHVTSVFGVFARLHPFGVLPQVIAENLSVIVNQRLVRQLCRACAREAPLSRAQARWLDVDVSHSHWLPSGCPSCNGTGYRGRLPVYEILVIDDPMANCIAAGADRAQLRKLARDVGFEPTARMSRHRVLAGQTTIDEVFYATGEGPEHE